MSSISQPKGVDKRLAENFEELGLDENITQRLLNLDFGVRAMIVDSATEKEFIRIFMEAGYISDAKDIINHQEIHAYFEAKAQKAKGSREMFEAELKEMGTGLPQDVKEKLLQFPDHVIDALVKSRTLAEFMRFRISIDMQQAGIMGVYFNKKAGLVRRRVTKALKDTEL